MHNKLMVTYLCLPSLYHSAAKMYFFTSIHHRNDDNKIRNCTAPPTPILVNEKVQQLFPAVKR